MSRRLYVKFYCSFIIITVNVDSAKSVAYQKIKGKRYYFVSDLIQSPQLDIFLIKIRWIERKIPQEWMAASMLISRAFFHILVPPAPLRRHKSITYLFRVVNLPNQSGESTWGNLECGWSTCLQWTELTAAFAALELGRRGSFTHLEPQGS